MLQAKQVQAAEMMARGETDAEQIAGAVGVSAATLEKWKKNREFTQEYIQRRTEILSGAATKAIRTLTDIMLNSPSDKERLSAAKEILDRAGFRAKDAAASEGDPQLHITVSYGTEAAHGDRDSE